MSNFTCPTCGLTNIDCGKAGFKTKQEIELEKKLKIALKALNEIRNEAETATWNVNALWLIGTVTGAFYDMERI